jgi:7-cyano-7-deazaguanine synthase
MTSLSSPGQLGPRAVVLVSGGLDSCVAAAWAKKHFSECIPINFAYGQRHARELVASEQISEYLFGRIPRTINLSQAFYNIGGSSLTSGIRSGNPSAEAVYRTPSELPPTFVPGRNVLMLAVAASLGYTERANWIVGGWNILDYSGYPDCRPEFIEAMSRALAEGLGYKSHAYMFSPGIVVHDLNTDMQGIAAPLVHLSKVEIIRLGIELEAPLDLSWSCYAGGSVPCDECDSCKIRNDGFATVGIADPARV